MEIFTAFGTFILVLLILALLLTPIVALFSVLNKKFPDNEKLIWVLVIIFMPILGSIIYFIVGRPRQKTYQIRNSNQNYFKY